MRISRRKRTDSGLVIPEWARRGRISLRQGGLSGPVDSRLDFRIDPWDEGEVSVLFTGQSVDGELFDEVTSDEFPLAAGIHGVVGLAWRGVPPDYACSQVALGHNHGLLLFELRV